MSCKPNQVFCFNEEDRHLVQTHIGYIGLHLTTPSTWKLTTVYGLPQEPLEDFGSEYGHNIALQSPQSARCTRRLYCQHSAETYTLYRRHIRKLSQVHLRHLRQILRISWKDHISNIDVLRQAMSSIEAILTASQLRWTGHVTRMSSDSLPKAVFYGELSRGKRLRGGQRLRYKDVLKRHLKTTHIHVNTWEPIAHDRQKWRRAIHQGKTLIEEKLTQKYQHEHDRRHGLLGASIPTVFCDECGRGFVAQIGLNSQ